jgi:SulP family sulfate permease
VRFGYLDAVSAYRTSGAEAFAGDAAAGIVVAVMLVPQAMAYAQLSGMPPVTGFFAAILSLFFYPVFGSSGHQAVGPVALLALMTQAAVSAVAGDGAAAMDRYANVAAKLAFLIGVAQLLMGVLRAGYVLNFLSHSVLAGFTTSSAVIIAASQLSKAFGFSTPQRSYVWQTFSDFFAGLGAGKLHGLSLGLFIMNMLLFFVLTEGRARLMASAAVRLRPALKALLRVLSVALVIIAFNILLVGGLRLDLKGVKVLGRIPSGMPPFKPAAVFDETLAADAFALLPSALLISLVSFVESASVAKSMQAKFGVTPGTLGANDNQELLGLGLANVATAFFSGFPVTGGFSRSTVNSEAGARTVMAGVISGTILCIVVSFLTSWFFYLPDVSLAALIMFSALRLLESGTIRYLWTVDRGDAIVWLATIAVTFGAGIELGLLVGAGVSVLRVVEKAAQPHTAVLGRMPDGTTFRNVKRFPTLAAPVPGVVIVRLDGPLFFANLALFVDRVVGAAFPPPDDIAAAAAAAEAARLPTQAVLLDFSTVASIDSAGVHALSETIPEALKKAAASAHLKPPRLFLVGARGPVRDRLRAGERAHANAHAQPPGCAAPLKRAASIALRCGQCGASAAGTPSVDSGAHASEAAVSLGGLYSGASGPAARAASRSPVAELLARTDPATGALPNEALKLFWHMDLHQGVEAVIAVLRDANTEEGGSEPREEGVGVGGG